MSGIGRGGPKRARKPLLRNSIQGISNDAIRRIAHKAGAKRISGLVPEETRGVLRMLLEKILKDSITLTDHSKMKTVQGFHVRQATELNDEYIAVSEYDQVNHKIKNPSAYAAGLTHKSSSRVPHRKLKGKVLSRGGDPSDPMDVDVPYDNVPTITITDADEQLGGARKPHKFRPGTVALKNIRYYQRKPGFVIPVASFQRLVREVAQDYKTNLRFSEEALRLLQYYIEAKLHDIFNDAVVSAIHARRQTVQPKDIQLARYIRNSYFN